MKKTLCFLLTLLLLAGCGPSGNEADTNGLSIVTTLFPTYDFARTIAGGKAEVKLLLTPGKESHSYEPSAGDIIDINNCDIFVFTGEYMEPWVKGLTDSLDGNPMIVDASLGLVLDEEAHDHDHKHEGHSHIHEYDPHIWTSPKNCITIVDMLAKALIKADPENRAYYRSNAEALKKELSELDKELREAVNEGSTAKLYHGGRFSMYYFTKEYGLSWEAAYDSCSSDAEPSVRRICEMIDEMREDGAKVVFYEELSNNSVAKLIGEETGAKPLLLHSCHNISQQEWDSGETYLSLMQKNVENLKEALQ